MAKRRKPTKKPAREAQKWGEAVNRELKIPAEIRRMLSAGKKEWRESREREEAAARAATLTDREAKQRDAIITRIVQKLGISDELDQLKAIEEAHAKRMRKVLEKSAGLSKKRREVL